MHRKHVLTVTALTEGGTGLLLLLVPLIPIRLLLGLDHVAPEALPIARIAGAGLIAWAVACWGGRNHPAVQPGVLLGVLVYDVAAAGILAHAGSVMHLAGILLWPAVGLHAGLAAWCAYSLSRK